MSETNIFGNADPLEPFAQLIEDYEEDRIEYHCMECWRILYGREDVCPECKYPIKWGDEE